MTGNFSAVTIAKTATIGTETTGTFTAAAYAAPAAASTISLDVTIDGVTTVVTTAAFAGTETAGQAATLIQNAITASAVTGRVTADTSGGFLRLTAANSDVDIQVNANTASQTAGLTTDAVTDRNINSSNLLDLIGTSGQTLSVAVNGGTAQTITFSNAGVSRISELNTQLQALTGGVSASAAAGAGGLSFSLAAGATNTLTVATSNTGLRDALGLNTARTAGQGGGLGTGVTDLSRTYNSAATLADADPTNLLSGGNLTITVNGSAQTVGFLGSDRLSDIIGKLQGNATLNNNLTFADDGNGDLSITAKNADVDFAITGNNVATAIGLTAGSYDSTSLLDRLNTKLGGSAGQGATLTVAGNGGQTSTLTFGTGSGEISTKAELTTALASVAGGVTASFTGTSLSFQVGAGTSQTSLTFGGTAAAALGFTAGTTNGAVSSTTSNSTRAALQNDYNDVLTQIDTLAKNSSYNGVNLLNGDNLKVVFNEKGTSTLNISGVTFGSSGLGLSSVSGTAFQADTQIDTTITSLDGALSSLRTQSSKFGSSLTTVQTRQDFTKQLINTLQTGAERSFSPTPTRKARTCSPCRPASSCPRPPCRSPRRPTRRCSGCSKISGRKADPVRRRGFGPAVFFWRTLFGRRPAEVSGSCWSP